MNKHDVKTILVGVNLKLSRVKNLINEHLKQDGTFDNEEQRTRVLGLLDEADDMIKTTRNELS
jgi:hypothetical protein